MTMFHQFRDDKKGATAIEYGLIAALIAVAAITAMQGLGNQIGSTMNQTADSMKAGEKVAPR